MSQQQENTEIAILEAYASSGIGINSTGTSGFQYSIEENLPIPSLADAIDACGGPVAAPAAPPASGKSDVSDQGGPDRLEEHTPLHFQPDAAVQAEAPPCGLNAEALLRALWRDPAHHHQIGAMRRTESGSFQNIAVSSARSAIEKASKLSTEGFDTYFACAEYLASGSRKADNVAQVSAFWVDLDCGDDKASSGKGYASIDEAHTALDSFCSIASIQAPNYIVGSGGGLHAYWVLDRPITPAAWSASALKLKELAKINGLLADPSRTADIASVLRIPDTQNHKCQPSRPVTLTKAEVHFVREQFLEALDCAHQKFCSRTAQLVEPSAPTSTSSQPATYGPLDMAKLESALAWLDPDCDEATWKLKRLAPMANAARENAAIAGEMKSLAKRWSSGELQGKPATAWQTPGTSSGITGEAAFEIEWRRFTTCTFGGKQTTLGTIFFDAKQAGWTSNESSPTTPTTADAEIAPLLAARQMVVELLQKVKQGDSFAPLEEKYATALAQIHDDNPAEYQRVRAQLKAANRQVPLSAVDMAMKASLGHSTTAQTHHGYAKALIKGLTVDRNAPVGHEGSLYVIDPATNIWTRKEQGALEQSVAESHDGNDNCKRRSDYAAIALHAISIVGSERFFPDAPVGLACEGSFYRMAGDKPVVEPLTPAHRQRVSLAFTPTQMLTPMFDDFLHQTFRSPNEGEEAQQVTLVQEIFGAVMLGIAHRYQKAALFFDPFGRAGKGTLEAMIRSVVPPEFVTAVSPFKWSQDYHLVSLAGARLNVVGELPDNEPIPAAAFKSVLGGDLVTGRNPTHRPISFKNEAAHIFTSNHLINSRDQSEAFFARWLIVEFPNSRLRNGLPLDPNLADRIIQNELPGIAHWALQGAARLLRNGRYSSSAVHDRLMFKWRRSNSSLEEFIFEACELSHSFNVRRATLYAEYKNWCAEAGRKPFSKSSVKELLEHNVGLGVTWASLDGNEIFRGIRLKQTK